MFTFSEESFILYGFIFYMVEKTLIYLSDNLKIKKTDKLLLAVSGGIDSMVMLDIFTRSNYKIAVAHCNFQLRGKESDDDEALIKNICQRLTIPFHSVRFETQNDAEAKNISIQMAARDLRYEWFGKLRLKLGYDYIAIAHNANDVVETFFINLSRGTGIKGLTGIKAKTKNLIRPLLPFSRAEIEEYSTKNNIQFREDASNASDKYHRNRIRHNIIPEFQKINPSFLSTMLKNIERMNSLSILLDNELYIKKQHLITKVNDSFRINIEQLKKEKKTSFILFEIINQYGFNASQVDDIISSLETQPGQEFLSPSYRLIKDRVELIIIKNEKQRMNDRKYIFEIHEGQGQISDPISLKLEYLEKQPAFKPSRNENIAEVDAAKITFPLHVRKWKLGDYFYPLGMKNKKKLSDYFVDNKFSIVDKENTWLLTSGEKIIWIINHRIDDRFKITTNTKNILKLSLL